jgi:phospholipid/cholesterol/gamma-HCH transport system permease protein
MHLHTNGTDIVFAMVKGLVFGVLIVTLSCHQGLNVSHGAVGVGRGTTRAMVYSSLAILIVNFFLTMVLSLIFPAGAAAN